MRGLLAIVAVCGLLCWPASLLVERTLDARAETRCSANLAAIGVAMHDYHAKYGHFPPAYVADAQGRPIHSWRVLLLEFLDPALFRQYDFREPWNGPHNFKLARNMPLVYVCPSRHGHGDPKRTSYAVIAGAESAFPGSGVVKMADICDATSDQFPPLLVAEVASLDIMWSEPEDVLMDQFPLNCSFDCSGRAAVSGDDRRGAGLLLLDGRVVRVSPAMHPNMLRAMITVCGSEWICTEG
jgi:hypothetical protein